MAARKLDVVALPDIGRDLGYSPRTLQSVVSAYAIASSGFLLVGDSPCTPNHS